MKFIKGKRIAGICCTILILMLVAACSLGGMEGMPSGAFDAVSRDVKSGDENYSSDGNPLINKDLRYSSDPALCVVNYNGRNVLMMVTSSDMKIHDPAKFPMDSTYLYTTDSADRPMEQWEDHGAVLRETDFDWANKTAKHLWAPDIQFVRNMPEWENNNDRIYLYVPAVDTQGLQRIGVAYADTTDASLYGQFTYEPDFFKINGNIVEVPNGGFSYDPGVFFDDPDFNGTGEYYMAYCNTEFKSDGYDYSQEAGATIGLIKMDSSMTSGEYLGPIKFKKSLPYDPESDYPELSKIYMEGPDINIMRAPDGTPYYYLQFAAKTEGGEATEYIGYATAAVDEFADNPTGCWHFQGWIFRNLKTGWTNHANLVAFNNKHYVFYHRVFPGSDTGESRSRQVCIKEIELNNECGKIVGVNPENWFDSLDGNTRTIDKGFFYMRDNAAWNSKKTGVFLSYYTNKTNETLRNFKLYYYLKIEDGRNLAVDNYSPFFDITRKHIGGKIWAVVLNAKDYITLEPGQSLPDTAFDLHYSNWENFDKSNDFSQPIANYNTWSTRIVLKNADDETVSGEEPLPTWPDDTSRYLRNAWTSAYLTCTSQSENKGINEQTLNTGWTSQEWYIEDCSGTTINADGKQITLPDNAVRLRNVWAKNYYMTCNNSFREGYYYWILSQSLHTDWRTQIWIKEPAGDRWPGGFRLRCFWDQTTSPNSPPAVYPLYLTTHSNGGDRHDVYAQTKDNGWASQVWYIE